MAGRTPTRGTDELPVSTVRRDATADDHPERREGGNQTHGTHDVLAAGKQTHRITSKTYPVHLVQRNLAPNSDCKCQTLLKLTLVAVSGRFFLQDTFLGGDDSWDKRHNYPHVFTLCLGTQIWIFRGETRCACRRDATTPTQSTESGCNVRRGRWRWRFWRWSECGRWGGRWCAAVQRFTHEGTTGALLRAICDFR